VVIEKGRKSLPPYVSYRTFRNFIDGLQLGMPSRIDRSYWGERLSGSNGTQLMTALRFLGLIDSDGIPQTRLRQLVSARGTQRSEILKQIAYTAFSFLAERSLDPQVATYSQLEEAFYNTYQVTGDVARKCIKFFVNLEGDAGIILSPFIMKKSKTLRADSVRKKVPKKLSTGTIQNSAVSLETDSIPTQMTWYEMVLAKFPTFDPTWSDEVKLKWFEAFDALLKKGSSDTESNIRKE
jgi:hypothetical protein